MVEVPAGDNENRSMRGCEKSVGEGVTLVRSTDAEVAVPFVFIALRIMISTNVVFVSKGVYQFEYGERSSLCNILH